MFRKAKSESVKPAVNALDFLIAAPGLWNLNEFERRDLTISCRDTDYIKKVKGAGSITVIDSEKCQLMHDGTIVALGGYHGEWMADIITKLQGHHEPQEEKLFHEVLKRIGPNATMIEFGCFWAYYSLWFNRAIKNATNICCEPDPHNIKIGKRNVKLNSAKGFTFMQTAAGTDDGETITINLDSDPSTKSEVVVRTVDSIAKEKNIDFLDMLHLDVQGFELDALVGAKSMISAGKVRFLFVSTHHYSISQRANIHQECLDFIKEQGGHIIASHTVAESFSGDGLIVASFSDEDKDFTVETSICHTDKSLFRPVETDVALLVDYINNGGQDVEQ